MQDSYEARALFLIMWHGSPAAETKALFPGWCKELNGIRGGSPEETKWLLRFSREALIMKKENAT